MSIILRIMLIGVLVIVALFLFVMCQTLGGGGG